MTISNSISLLRAPLALLFLQDNVILRVIAVILAMITDSIDGYLARRYNSISKFGAILDPAMDKFFVYFVLMILLLEGQVHLWQALTMLSRDFALCIYGIYLTISNRWSLLEWKAIRWGKITTALQFLILIGLTLGVNFPAYVYGAFVAFGVLAFLELLQSKPSKPFISK